MISEISDIGSPAIREAFSASHVIWPGTTAWDDAMWRAFASIHISNIGKLQLSGKTKFLTEDA
jgi:hypothetical protein